MAESETPAYAHLSYGRWVAWCPVGTNAMYLEAGQTRFECGSPGGFGSCGATADVVWPPDPDAIALSLAGQPVEEQNWDPEV